MNAIQHLYDIALYSVAVADGGPRRYREREAPLPEKYLPGRMWQHLQQDVREEILRGLSSEPAPWALHWMVDDGKSEWLDAEMRKYGRVPMPTR